MQVCFNISLFNICYLFRFYYTINGIEILKIFKIIKSPNRLIKIFKNFKFIIFEMIQIFR